jgi:hypothetical protein
LVGQLINRLKATGLYDRALVIVTADHGASFEPNGYMRNVVQDNLPDIAGVPLLVKYPGQRQGRIDKRSAKTIDIVPTIADVVGVKIPWHVDGVSLRRAPVSRRVSVSKSDGDPVVGTVSAVEAGVLATVRRNAALFGIGKHSMYGMGPFPDALGRSVASLPSVGSPEDGVRFDDASLFANVRASSGLVPTRIAGVISGNTVPDGTPLAIAVDGRVRATTRSYALDGQRRFDALVPETSFREGRNSVEIYSAARSNGTFHLARLGGTPPSGAGPTAAATSITASATEGHQGP